MTEMAFGRESMGVHVGVAPWLDAGREVGHLTVARWDAEQTEWASRKLGGEGTGEPGFVQPNDVMFRQLHVRPFSVTTSPPDEHNLITRAGYQRIFALMTGGGGTTWASATCRIGVGTATQAAATGDTDLIAITGTAARWFNMVTGNGVTGAGTATCRLSFTSTFATGDANFPNPWQEWAIDMGAAGSGTGAATATLLNRAVSPQGSKVSGQTWTATANLDFS